VSRQRDLPLLGVPKLRMHQRCGLAVRGRPVRITHELTSRPSDAGAIVTTPELQPLTEGRWQARCQFCKVESIPVPAVDAAHAWGDLEKLGWETYQPVPGAVVTALRRACGEKNARIMASVKAARKGRKRK
jgi:hypothetical protein